MTPSAVPIERERPARVDMRQSPPHRALSLRGELREIDASAARRRRAADSNPHTVAVADERRAQRLLQPRNLRQRLLPCRDRESAVDAYGHRAVVLRLPRLHAIEKPEPPLRERQRRGRRLL